jgi:ATP-binding cassette subfamily B protein RaxB
MVAGYHGHGTHVSALRERWRVSLKGVSLAQLMRMSQELHLTPRALRLPLEQLGALRRPAILYWDLDHFVVLERVKGDEVWIVDPAVGRRRLKRSDVSRHFTGVALELVPTPEFQRREEPPPLQLKSFFRGVRGLAGALARVLALSLALQVFLLVAPFFSQIAVDDIVISSDRDLLTVLGIGFLLLVVIQSRVQALRAWLVVTLGASLQFGWVTRLFHHLIRLPLDYFEKRHTGDIEFSAGLGRKAWIAANRPDLACARPTNTPMIYRARRAQMPSASSRRRRSRPRAPQPPIDW